MNGTSPHWMSKWAHDLRGPLSPIQSALFLLRHGSADGPERDELFELVDRQIRRLTGMIDEIGDWVRSDQGRLLTRSGPIDLALIIEASRGIGANAVEVSYEDGADNVCLEGDASRLANLLSTFFWLVSTPLDTPLEAGVANATKGTVTVRLDDGGVWLAGPLSAALRASSNVDTLFTEPQPAPAGDGLGLRLLIASAIATGHGGELATRATDDGGVDVVLRLPYRPA
ncbi:MULTISPECIES: HAMP domain-containing sensor histidine kinase [unclassified Lysobacter]|uniref:sensor histidine kinase n=1 Tax=unclassified Lysobacter TaxID=2635362 RepID=UPI001C242CDD|nr:HAMP domain-containing sensor histidine kinase [Lysobacter sp. MMG2]MBU8977095.1 HAMP domain-containing histidine kinase [Lysobacter sp. MMG2]